MRKNNPFTLSFGKQPNEYISRYENAETIISAFDAENPISQAYLIEGIRGSGKTVLMTAISKDLGVRKDWIVVDLNSSMDLLEDFAIRLYDECQKIPNLFEGGFSISVAGFGIGINGSPKTHDYISIIEKILSRVKRKRKKIVITIDEASNNQNMKNFASEFQILIRKEYPIFLLMTGLYENINAIQNNPALTFLLRTPKIMLEPLSLRQVANQYKAVFRIDDAMAKQLANITKGYAFAFQALGLLYFEHRSSLSLDEILTKLDDMLDDFVYKKIWEQLSSQEKKIVLAIQKDRTAVKDLCVSLSMTSSTFSKYRDRLIKKGIIISTGHGLVSLALPRFLNVVEYYG